MKQKRIIEYANGSYRERLKPFLFWMIVAAATLALSAIAVALYAHRNRVVE